MRLMIVEFTVALVAVVTWAVFSQPIRPVAGPSKATAPAAVTPTLLAEIAARLESNNFQDHSPALADLSKLLTANKGQEADFEPMVGPLFKLAGWGGIARKNSLTAEALIVSIGGPALPLLKQRLKSGDAHGRRVAIELLVRIGPWDTALVSLLRPFLKDQDRYVRQAVIAGFAAAGPRAKEAIGDLELVATNDPELSRRAAARNALVQVCGASFERIQALAAFLEFREDDDGLDACTYAASALGNLGAKARSAEGRLLAALKHPHAQVRINAAGALGDVGANSPETIAALIDLLKNDPSKVTRRTAAGSLGQIGPRAKGAIPALREVLKGDKQESRWVAVDALCKVGGSEIVPDLVELLASAHVGIRLTSIRGLGDLGVDAKPAVSALEKIREQDPRERNRAAAAEALRNIEQAIQKKSERILAD